MKRVFLFVLTAALLVPFTSCGSRQENKVVKPILGKGFFASNVPASSPAWLEKIVFEKDHVFRHYDDYFTKTDSIIYELGTWHFNPNTGLIEVTIESQDGIDFEVPVEKLYFKVAEDCVQKVTREGTAVLNVYKKSLSQEESLQNAGNMWSSSLEGAFIIKEALEKF